MCTQWRENQKEMYASELIEVVLYTQLLFTVTEHGFRLM